MKIIIIGFDGQLGTDCVALLKDKHIVKTPTLKELNFLDRDLTLSYLDRQHADVIINCAAYTAVDKCESEVDLAHTINAKGPEYLAQSCQNNGTRLIHVSTDYVFDGMKEVPDCYLETDDVNPLSQYGRTKLAGEKNVLSGCDDHAILRTAWLYSANGPNFLKTMLRLAVQDPKAARKIVNDQYGSLTWSYTLARQIEKLLTSEIQGIVHTTSEGYSTWYEAACYFLEKMEVPHNLVPCTTAEYPTPAHRPANSILENSVLKGHNISCFVDWKEDVDQFVQEYGKALLAKLQ
ncbi:MAG: dTDP-4-dehydrorhamnose reductase [Desulfobacterales bacterium]|nr:MAG: dTDP-4-dehydrorhamnose reductase [Desulfobacterales bacterium]